VHIPLVCFGIAFPSMVLLVESLYRRLATVIAITLLGVGATLTVLGDDVVLAVEVIALSAFIMVGAPPSCCIRRH
jgi:hypothetical protein